MSEASHFVVFLVGQQRFAISIAHVLRVVAVAEWTVVPGTPEIILGILNFHGEVVAVVDLRHRLSSSTPPVSLVDQLIIVRTHRRMLALLVNETLGVIKRDPPAIASLDTVEFKNKHFDGATTLNDGLVLIHDIEKFLLPQEAQVLERAIERSHGYAPEGSP